VQREPGKGERKRGGGVEADSVMPLACWSRPRLEGKEKGRDVRGKRGKEKNGRSYPVCDTAVWDRGGEKKGKKKKKKKGEKKEKRIGKKLAKKKKKKKRKRKVRAPIPLLLSEHNMEKKKEKGGRRAGRPASSNAEEKGQKAAPLSPFFFSRCRRKKGGGIWIGKKGKGGEE